MRRPLPLSAFVLGAAAAALVASCGKLPLASRPQAPAAPGAPQPVLLQPMAGQTDAHPVSRQELPFQITRYQIQDTGPDTPILDADIASASAIEIATGSLTPMQWIDVKASSPVEGGALAVYLERPDGQLIPVDGTFSLLTNSGGPFTSFLDIGGWPVGTTTSEWKWDVADAVQDWSSVGLLIGSPLVLAPPSHQPKIHVTVYPGPPVSTGQASVSITPVYFSPVAQPGRALISVHAKGPWKLFVDGNSQPVKRGNGDTTWAWNGGGLPDGEKTFQLVADDSAKGALSQATFSIDSRPPAIEDAGIVGIDASDSAALFSALGEATEGAWVYTVGVQAQDTGSGIDFSLASASLGIPSQSIWPIDAIPVASDLMIFQLAVPFQEGDSQPRPLSLSVSVPDKAGNIATTSVSVFEREDLYEDTTGMSAASFAVQATSQPAVYYSRSGIDLPLPLNGRFLPSLPGPRETVLALLSGGLSEGEELAAHIAGMAASALQAIVTHHALPRLSVRVQLVATRNASWYSAEIPVAATSLGSQQWFLDGQWDGTVRDLATGASIPAPTASYAVKVYGPRGMNWAFTDALGSTDVASPRLRVAGLAFVKPGDLGPLANFDITRAAHIYYNHVCRPTTQWPVRRVKLPTGETVTSSRPTEDFFWAFDPTFFYLSSPPGFTEKSDAPSFPITKGLEQSAPQILTYLEQVAYAVRQVGTAYSSPKGPVYRAATFMPGSKRVVWVDVVPARTGIAGDVTTMFPAWQAQNTAEADIY